MTGFFSAVFTKCKALPCAEEPIPGRQLKLPPASGRKMRRGIAGFSSGGTADRPCFCRLTHPDGALRTCRGICAEGVSGKADPFRPAVIAGCQNMHCRLMRQEGRGGFFQKRNRLKIKIHQIRDQGKCTLLFLRETDAPDGKWDFRFPPFRGVISLRRRLLQAFLSCCLSPNPSSCAAWCRYCSSFSSFSMIFSSENR